MLVENKGFFDLLYAIPNVLNKVENCFFVIAGGPSLSTDDMSIKYINEIEKIIANLDIGNKIRFLGYVEDMSTFYKVIDVLVITSHEESMPLVAIEGMFMAKPIIANSVGGIPEILKNGINVILVNTKNPEELSDAILKLINQDDLRKEMGILGKVIIEGLSSNETYIKFIQNIILETSKRYKR